MPVLIGSSSSYTSTVGSLLLLPPAFPQPLPPCPLLFQEVDLLIFSSHSIICQHTFIYHHLVAGWTSRVGRQPTGTAPTRFVTPAVHVNNDMAFGRRKFCLELTPTSIWSTFYRESLFRLGLTLQTSTWPLRALNTCLPEFPQEYRFYLDGKCLNGLEQLQPKVNVLLYRILW